MAAIKQFANGGEAVYSGSNYKVILEMRQLDAAVPPLLEATAGTDDDVCVPSCETRRVPLVTSIPRALRVAAVPIAGTMVMTKFAAECCFASWPQASPVTSPGLFVR